jgi:hypothetical protein
MSINTYSQIFISRYKQLRFAKPVRQTRTKEHIMKMKDKYKMVGNKIVQTTSINKSTTPQNTTEEKFIPLTQVVENLKRLGEKTFEAPDITYTKAQPEIPLTKAQIYFIAAQGYYVCRDGEKTLFLNPKQGRHSTSQLPVMLRKPLEGCSGSGIHTIKTFNEDIDIKSYKGYKKPQGTTLSQAEFESILKGKPTIQQLLDAYDQYRQESVDFDISKSQPVW